MAARGPCLLLCKMPSRHALLPALIRESGCPLRCVPCLVRVCQRAADPPHFRRPWHGSRRRVLHQQTYSLLDTIAGVDSKGGNTFRRHEERAPPHLPLPPTLPYQPTSTPFRRHLQILEESLLSSSAQPSWEIFAALHEDLRRRHLPPDTLRALLAKQVDGIAATCRGQTGQWRRVREILEILDECSVSPRPEDLDRIIVAGIDHQGRRIPTKHFKIDQLQAVWNNLSTIHAGQLHNISLSARERWLLFRVSRSKKYHAGRGEFDHDTQSEMRAEWRRLASHGFFKGVTISEQVLQAYRGDYLYHVKDIVETLRVIYQNGGIIPLDTLRSVWWNHLDARITTFEPPDPEVYRFIDASLSAKTPDGGSFDMLSREALQQAIAQTTGNVEVSALSLYLPFDKLSVLINGSHSLEEALHLTRRRIKQIPRQPPESQTPNVVTSLGFGALLVEDAVTKGIDISDSVAVVMCRGFKYLPSRIRTDERYASRLRSALLLLLRSLRRQDSSLMQWSTIWPTMLEAISGFSTDGSGNAVLPHTMFLYRQMRKQKLSEHLDFLAGFREDFIRKILNYPWVALELYVDAVAAGTEGDSATRAAIVFRIATMKNAGYLRRVRTTVNRCSVDDQRSSSVFSILCDAISTCESPEHAMLLYELLRDRDPAAEALGLLLAKMQELGDYGQRQRAVSIVEDAYSKGRCLSRDGLETLVGLLDGETRGADISQRMEIVEEALRSNKRLFVAQST